VVGFDTSWLGQKFKQALRVVRERRSVYAIHGQAAELLRLFGRRMPAARRERLERLVGSKRSVPARLAYALSGQIVHRDPVGKVAVRGLILADWY
jgi:hypothetical protein